MTFIVLKKRSIDRNEYGNALRRLNDYIRKNTVAFSIWFYFVVVLTIHISLSKTIL